MPAVPRTWIVDQAAGEPLHVEPTRTAARPAVRRVYLGIRMRVPRGRGMGVIRWTVYEPADRERRVDPGAGLITDDPDRAGAVLTRRGGAFD